MGPTPPITPDKHRNPGFWGTRGQRVAGMEDLGGQGVLTGPSSLGGRSTSGFVHRFLTATATLRQMWAGKVGASCPMPWGRGCPDPLQAPSPPQLMKIDSGACDFNAFVLESG